MPTPNPLIMHSVDQSLSVSRYWARPGKKGQNTAAYMVIKNNAGTDGLALVKATSSVCREVQIHTTLEETIEGNIVKKMRQVEGIELPPHQEIALAPGGYHIMLIGLKKDIHLDKPETVDLTLFFAGGQTISLTLPIKKKLCSCCEEAAKKDEAVKKDKVAKKEIAKKDEVAKNNNHEAEAKVKARAKAKAKVGLND